MIINTLITDFVVCLFVYFANKSKRVEKKDLESSLRANGKRQFVPRDPLFPLTFSYIYTQIRTVSCQVYT